MKSDRNFSCLRKSICVGSDLLQNRKTKVTVAVTVTASRKRRRPGYCQFVIMSSTVARAAASFSSNSCSKIIPRREISWQLLLTMLFVAINTVSGSSSSLSSTPATGIVDHTHRDRDSEIFMAESIWQAIDDESASSSLHQPALSWLKQPSEEEESSSSHTPGHRSLRGKERTRERFRKEHTFAVAHYPASPEERHRLLISCDERQTQEDCLSKLLEIYDVPYEESNNLDGGHRRRIELIHNLKSVHALSVDVDAQTLGNLAIDQEFVFEKDFPRVPLVIDGSMAYYQPPSEDGNRNLQSAQEIPWGLEAIRAQEVWREFGVQGKGVKICVLDSGVQAPHEDFRQSKFSGYYGTEFNSPWYEDANGHGTHTAGIIAASDNSIGIVGIAPEADTYIVRVFDDDRNFLGFSDGTAYSTDLIAAATICKEKGADIINASLGGNSYNRIEEEFFRNLYYESGILTVAASGNGGDARNVYPAAYEGVLSVGAIDESLHMAKFSTWEPKTTDVLAPGVNILSTFTDNMYATFSGTSMAAPHATGALALVLSYISENQVDISRQEIFHALKHTTMSVDTSRISREADTNDHASPSNDEDSPTIGVIDVYAAIEYLQSYKREHQAVGRSPVIPTKEFSTTRCEIEIRLDITTDSKGDEIYYRLMRLSDKEPIWMRGPNTLNSHSVYSEKTCLEGSEDCYQFDIRDTGGDGISDGGGIEIIYNGNTLYKGGNYGPGGILKFGDCSNENRI